MMVPEMLCERWTNISLIARKEEPLPAGATQTFIQLSCTHLDPCTSYQVTQTYSNCFNEISLFIYLPLAETEPSWVCLYEAAQRCVGIPVRGASRQTGLSTQGSTEILTWPWKLCSNVRIPLLPLGKMILLPFFHPVSRSLHSTALSAHMNLCIPTTALELCASCFLQPFPRRANGKAWLPTDHQDTACCGIWLTVKNNVLKCWHSDDFGLDSHFHKGWVSLSTLVEYFAVKQQNETMSHSSAVLKTIGIVPCLQYYISLVEWAWDIAHMIQAAFSHFISLVNERFCVIFSPYAYYSVSPYHMLWLDLEGLVFRAEVVSSQHTMMNMVALPRSLAPASTLEVPLCSSRSLNLL